MKLGRFAVMLLALGACKRQRPDCHFDRRLAFARDVPAGRLLDRDDFTSRAFRYGAPNAAGAREDDYSLAVGTVTREAHREGEPLDLRGLDPSPRPRPSTRTFRLEGDFGLALEAGDLVDVLTTTSERAATPVQAVRVLHVTGREVWLEVLPEEAEQLLLGRGTLALTRRAPDDCTELESTNTTVNTVLTGERTRIGCSYTRRHITIIKGSSPR